MKLSETSRKKAFFVHLIFSLSIFAVLSFLIVFVWYPSFYFYLDGGDRGLLTLFFVDVVLGPGLTLLVFKPGKKSLKFDISVILLLQLAALIWGIDSVYSERSGGAVFYWGKIDCVSQSDTGSMDMDAILSGPSGTQKLAFLQRPENISEFHDFVGKAFLQNSAEIYYYAKNIVPLDKENITELDNYNIDIEALREKSPVYADKVTAYMEQHAGNTVAYKLIPVACRYKNAVAVVDLNQIKVVEILDVDIELRAKDKHIFISDNNMSKAEKL